ncbi:MAG TPA: GNAT family N-acetyltransferase [Actinocrinis sp.]|uniref:GNAT family N-acetyltransferase n=1 Tax=Actinocrinis sp. TaxID=1920516 RepID=UPI002DDD9F07|nr:GNAT family N-acetyltransferase [Actinocrinis sp.]HEV3173615.1 GNAT family N-acetyltransferase [Actinocrinis sp.]
MPSSPTATATARFTVARADAHDWAFVARWCEREGWNPGRRDALGFLPQDPDGFFVGRLDGEIASAVSVVNYDDAFSFLGFYLVREDLRGRGLGMATWRQAVKHAGSRTIGLDGVPAQEANYERSGFSAVYRTVRYGGSGSHWGFGSRQTAAPGVVPADQVPVTAVAEFDRQCFPADRSSFVARWLSLPGHTSYVHMTGDRVTGYGVIRPSLEGYRIGPLFAADQAAAQGLFDTLAAYAGPGPVFMDVPEPNEAAHKLVAACGLAPGFETVRMYTGPTRPIAVGYVYGVTTLELG